MLDKAYKIAVHHPYTHLPSSADLRKFFLWGHRSDLQFVAAQNLLVALTKWRSNHPAVPWRDNTPLVKSLRTALSKLLCRFDNLGCVRWPGGSWDTSCPPAWCDRLAHNLRAHWRTMRLENWLKSSRNDAQVARQTGLTSSLVESLHQSSLHVTGHMSAVLAGGLRTAAHTTHKSDCTFCGMGVPSTDHIFWCCPFFNHLRLFPRPGNNLRARLGWDHQGIHMNILQQLAKIRESHAIQSLKYFHIDRGWGEGGGLCAREDCLLPSR